MAQNKTTNDAGFENVESALTRSEQFIEDNQKIISIVALAIIVLVGGYWGVKKLVFQPREKKAQSEMFFAQHYFEADSFKLALNGDGTNAGFLEIIDDFGSTKAGELSHYYAGICYLNLGEYQNAIKHLEKFSTDEEILSAMAVGATGDAYLESGNKDKAISLYKKASNIKNEMTAPYFLMKLGMLYEENGKNSDAVKTYQTIKDEYQNSAEARQVDKYLTRAQLNAN
jgi:tetratricopeptide (TPR) repeat protein